MMKTDNERLLVAGNGPLSGTIQASGAKNAVLPILAATILASEPVTLHNVPKLQDVLILESLLESFGATVTEVGKNSIEIDPRGITEIRASHDLVKLMRASILVLGPLLARFGEAEVSLPGGCAIGSRPVDQHLKGMEALGANITLKNGYVFAKTPNARLKGGHYAFDMVTVTGVENVIMAAVLADGVTVLDNCAKEPEVTDLVEMLISLGAQIEGVGTDRLTITGVEKLSGGEYTIMPDRIEIGTYLVAGAMTFGDITVERCIPAHLEAVNHKLIEAGCQIETGADFVRVFPGTSILKPLDIRTAPYPLFATDMQAQFMAMAAISQGTSTIVETIFENRFMHANELMRMGADIHVEERMAVIQGVEKLSGTEVTATDLRASAALILAGLVADGTTTIDGLHHLDRGYDGIERKLTGIGAKIERITLDEASSL